MHLASELGSVGSGIVTRRHAPVDRIRPQASLVAGLIDEYLSCANSDEPLHSRYADVAIAGMTGERCLADNFDRLLRLVRWHDKLDLDLRHEFSWVFAASIGVGRNWTRIVCSNFGYRDDAPKLFEGMSHIVE